MAKIQHTRSARYSSGIVRRWPQFPPLILAIFGGRSFERLGNLVLRIVPLEEHHVLPRQLVKLLDQLKSVRRKLFENLLLRHFVERLDWHVGIFAAKLHKGHSSRWF